MLQIRQLIWFPSLGTLHCASLCQVSQQEPPGYTNLLVLYTPVCMCSFFRDTCCRQTCPSRFLRPSTADVLWWILWSELLWSASALHLPSPAPKHKNFKVCPPHQAGHSLKEITAISSCETRCPTSALMLAMRRGEMFPHRTFRRRSGFFWSFRLEMRLRRRDLYFISVDLNSWKICGCDEQSRI